MKIKNKMTKYAILGIGVIGITVLCIVIYNFFRTRKITDFFENNPADIENITIMSGNNGNFKETDVQLMVKNIILSDMIGQQ